MDGLVCLTGAVSAMIRRGVARINDVVPRSFCTATVSCGDLKRNGVTQNVLLSMTLV